MKRAIVAIVIIAMVIATMPIVKAEDSSDLIDTNDFELYEKYRPRIVGEIKPERVYYKTYENIATGEQILIIFYFWNKQEYYIARHDYDYEPIIIFIQNDIIKKIAYDEWHYVIGRKTVDEVGKVTIKFVTGYRAIKPVSENDDIYTRAINYTDIPKIYITNEITGEIERNIGFDRRIINDPYIVYEESIFGGYKRKTFWDSPAYAFLTVTDRKIDWINFER